MSRINEYLNNIMKAVYGRDVRQSIHDAIKEIDSVADTAQGSATEMAKAAQEAAGEAGRHNEEAAVSAQEAAGSAQEANKSAAAAAMDAAEAEESKNVAVDASVKAAASEETAIQKATEADVSALAAKEAEQAAKVAMQKAEGYSDNATDKANKASASANLAEVKANSATAAAISAESYAHGGTGTRTGEDVDNARYYKEQAERITQGLAGGLLPMGTVTFSDLSNQTKNPGYMYNVSDAFTTTDEFKEGEGHEYAPGTNVYWTVDGFWDCIAGTDVVGVKGSAENEYRKGFVNIAAKDIGLGNVDNTSDMNKPISKLQQQALEGKIGLGDDTSKNVVEFESGDALTPTGWADVELFASGETHKGLFRKLSLIAKNTRYLYKLLGTKDISGLGDGTLTGAIRELNTGLGNAMTRTQQGLLWNQPGLEYKNWGNNLILSALPATYPWGTPTGNRANMSLITPLMTNIHPNVISMYGNFGKIDVAGVENGHFYEIAMEIVGSQGRSITTLFEIALARGASFSPFTFVQNRPGTIIDDFYVIYTIWDISQGGTVLKINSVTGASITFETVQPVS